VTIQLEIEEDKEEEGEKEEEVEDLSGWVLLPCKCNMSKSNETRAILFNQSLEFWKNL